MSLTAEHRPLLPIATAGESWAWLRAEFARVRRLTGLTLAVGTVGAAVSLVPIYVFGILVDRVQAKAPTEIIVGVVAVIAVAALLGGLFAGWGSVLISRLGEGMLARLRERTVERALTLPIATVERVGKGTCSPASATTSR
ncbi:xenobiotic-transporting ATPase domain protein [Rhodococcus sp. MTM3W5.2]|nr:xenobiotic-transporting ATPase domain protein [Rhodococcus sp. MTM3W5.2]